MQILVSCHLAVLYSSREPSELSQWLCHDDDCTVQTLSSVNSAVCLRDHCYTLYRHLSCYKLILENFVFLMLNA